ncbi:hypothetical protein AX774_g6548 [Zancudomyces culisetae]|uniref:Uncharacterized protein n=1 Tax=Zancudomyces culisetae TaxID=1213189 RepID=A0A1R1PGB8_ZANCU|nr:hypothetical protein AX774_g6548 [Zancudomyces culisetae]|eukprot:OMH80021.1 hypothetical protein AX774_g6548 [Zancudomyces culisetae]
MMRLNLVCMDSEFDSYSRNIETITQSRKMPDDLADLMSRMGISVKSDTYAKFGGLKTHRGIYYRDPYKGVLLQFSPNLVVEKYQTNRNPQQTQEDVEVKRESAKANSDADDNENITQTEGSSDIIEQGCNLASENGKKNNNDTDTDTLNSQSDISSSENDDGFTSDSENSVASEKTSFTDTNVESKDEMVESEEMVTYKFLECLLKDGICVVYTKRGINEISMQYFWDKIYSEFDRLSEKIKSKRANVSVDAEDKMDTSCENSNIIEKRINEAQKKKSLVKETDPEKDR